jgi:hypothetical protein
MHRDDVVGFKMIESRNVEDMCVELRGVIGGDQNDVGEVGSVVGHDKNEDVGVLQIMDEQLRDANPCAPSLKHWKRKAQAQAENVGPPLCVERGKRKAVSMHKLGGPSTKVKRLKGEWGRGICGSCNPYVGGGWCIAPPTKMKIISWNCRGLGNPWIVRDLCQMVKDKRPNYLFLMETKSSKIKMEWLRVPMGFEGMFAVDPIGCSGGLALMWKDGGEFEIQNFTRRHITSVVRPQGQGIVWRFMSFYGHPDPSRRHESWELLTHLKGFTPDPWLFVGDFNEVVEQSEKEGGI